MNSTINNRSNNSLDVKLATGIRQSWADHPQISYPTLTTKVPIFVLLQKEKAKIVIPQVDHHRYYKVPEWNNHQPLHYIDDVKLHAKIYSKDIGTADI